MCFFSDSHRVPAWPYYWGDRIAVALVTPPLSKVQCSPSLPLQSMRIAQDYVLVFLAAAAAANVVVVVAAACCFPAVVSAADNSAAVAVSAASAVEFAAAAAALVLDVPTAVNP